MFVRKPSCLRIKCSRRERLTLSDVFGALQPYVHYAHVYVVWHSFGGCSRSRKQQYPTDLSQISIIKNTVFAFETFTVRTRYACVLWAVFIVCEGPVLLYQPTGIFDLHSDCPQYIPRPSWNRILCSQMLTTCSCQDQRGIVTG